MNFGAVNDRVLAGSPEASAKWQEKAAALDFAMMLVRTRKSRGLKQSDVAARAGWDKSFVSRLERPGGAIPDFATMGRYFAACEASVGLIVGSTSTPLQLHVEDAVTLGGEDGNLFEGLRDTNIALDARVLSAAN